MKKIYLCTSGANKSVVESMFCKSIDNIKSDKNYGFNYYVIDDGPDDVVEVLNYNVPIMYKVKDNDSVLDLMAQGYNVYLDISSGDIIILQKDNSFKHIVKPLETIIDIANKYKVSVNDIKLNNNLLSDKLYIGQILKI